MSRQPHDLPPETLDRILEAVRDLREDWRTRPEHHHPYLSTPDIVPTVVSGGEWMVTYPSSCSLTFDVQYMPCRVSTEGSGADVFRELEARIAAATADDPWLAEHPLRFEWPCDIVPAEVPDDHPIVGLTLGAAGAVGRSGVISGLDSWHDAAVFTRRAATPTVSFGPGGIGDAHTIDEYVPVDDLIDCAAAIAVALLRWCGTA